VAEGEFKQKQDELEKQNENVVEGNEKESEDENVKKGNEDVVKGNEKEFEDENVVEDKLSRVVAESSSIGGKNFFIHL